MKRAAPAMRRGCRASGGRAWVREGNLQCASRPTSELQGPSRASRQGSPLLVALHDLVQSSPRTAHATACGCCAASRCQAFRP
eukprot:scaffold73238_cov31-Tisochrysis_lutea.AAC.1